MPSQLAITPLLSGFGLGAGLIIAIGSQNAFVLRQGLKREHVFTVCTVCFLCDAVLIGLGAGGFGTLVGSSPRLMGLALWGGAAFLFAYGLRSFHAALRPGRLEAAGDDGSLDGPVKVVLTTLALSLLNPHVYLDTVLLLGSLAGQFAGRSRALFALGAMGASLTWFYGIGYGARVLTPLFRKPAAWRALDLVVGCTMWGIAANLIWSDLTGG